MSEVTFALLSMIAAAFALISAAVDVFLRRLGWTSVAAYLIGGAVGGALLALAASFLPGEEDDQAPVIAAAIGGAVSSVIYRFITRRSR